MDNPAYLDQLISIAFITFYFFFLFVFILGYYIVTGISFFEIAKRIGHKNGWFAWVPILSSVLKLNIAGFSAWYLFMYLLVFVPVLGWIGLFGFWIFVWMKIAERCGKPDYLGLLVIVPFGKYVLPLYLAYSSKKQGGVDGVQNSGVKEKNTIN
jgi:hypothetical protein